MAASPRYSAPITTSAMVVASGTSLWGDRYSAANGATASQPANAHTRAPAAVMTAGQPWGAIGPTASGRAWGSAIATVTTIVPARTAASASCTRPDSRTPNAFMPPTPRISAAATPTTVARPPPNAAAT